MNFIFGYYFNCDSKNHNKPNKKKKYIEVLFKYTLFLRIIPHIWLNSFSIFFLFYFGWRLRAQVSLFCLVFKIHDITLTKLKIWRQEKCISRGIRSNNNCGHKCVHCSHYLFLLRCLVQSDNSRHRSINILIHFHVPFPLCTHNLIRGPGRSIGCCICLVLRTFPFCTECPCGRCHTMLIFWARCAFY